MGAVLDKTREGLEESFEEKKAQWSKLDPDGNFREILLEDDRVLNAIIEGSYAYDSGKHWLVGKIPTEDGIETYSDLMTAVVEGNNLSF